MEVGSFEITSTGDDGNPNEIRIEIQPDHDGSHNTIHTIQLQSPGGSSHFVEGLVVTTTSQQLPNSNAHMAYAHGSTIIVENHDRNSIHQNGSLTMTRASIDDGTEQIICGPGIQVVGLATNEKGETIFIVPKQESSPVVLMESTSEEVETSDCLDTNQGIPIHISDSHLTSITMATTQNGVPTLVSSDSQLLVKNNLIGVDGNKNERPKRKAALKAIAARKTAKKKREKYAASKQMDQLQKIPVCSEIRQSSESLSQHPETIIGLDLNHEIGKENTDPDNDSELMLEDHNDISEVKVEDEFSSSEDEEIETRRCVVCLRRRRFTEDIFDSSKQLYYHIDVLIAHLNIQAKGTPANTGLCPECMNNLQRWHVFNCAIVKRQEEARNTGAKVIEEPICYQSFESRVYKNYKKMAKVKEVYHSATHTQYTRRHLNEKDWDFFCDHLFHSNSVKSEKSKELEKFLTCREKLSHMYCMKCQKLIPNGKRGYMKHMHVDHQESPVLFPCDICGNTFPEKDMTASTEDYYPHWISHFYFNKCDDCGKRFPTKRALGQHRHAVHKNRQVKCDKCGKVLANKMSLDLHLLRHLPENEKKKYMIKCKICKKKIAQWNLKSHMATHNDERPWKCDHCEATFKMKGALVSHRDVVHFNLKNHVCSLCGDAFKSASSLRGHVRRHEGRKDYKCEVCLKEYYTYSALKGHKVVHQTARDFICVTCGKAFKKKKALEEHVTIHTGEKPHRCPICGREIRVKSNLYKHMKIHKKTNSSSNQTRRKGNAPSNNASDEHQLLEGNSHLIRNASATQEANGTVTVTLDNGTVIGDHNGTPIVVSIVTTGNENIMSPSSIVEISSETQTQIINTVSLQPGHKKITPVCTNNSGGTTTFLSHQSNMVQTLTMQQIEHQDLLNVPLQAGHYYSTTPQYFSTLDRLQN